MYSNWRSPRSRRPPANLGTVSAQDAKLGTTWSARLLGGAASTTVITGSTQTGAQPHSCCHSLACLHLDGWLSRRRRDQLVGIPDVIQFGSALLAGKVIQVGGLDELTNALAKDRDVNVFRESGDESEGFESEVPPLNSSRGPSAGNPLNKASRVQQTQKSFSTFCTEVSRRSAVVRKRPRRSASVAAMTV